MPEVILSTNVSMIELAMEGKIDFIKKTNPFGSGEEEDKEEDLLAKPANPEEAAQKLMQFVGQKRDADARTKPRVPRTKR